MVEVVEVFQTHGAHQGVSTDNVDVQRLSHQVRMINHSHDVDFVSRPGVSALRRNDGFLQDVLLLPRRDIGSHLGVGSSVEPEHSGIEGAQGGGKGQPHSAAVPHPCMKRWVVVVHLQCVPTAAAAERHANIRGKHQWLGAHGPGPLHGVTARGHRLAFRHNREVRVASALKAPGLALVEDHVVDVLGGVLVHDGRELCNMEFRGDVLPSREELLEVEDATDVGILGIITTCAHDHRNIWHQHICRCVRTHVLCGGRAGD
mmetsp:Transcript_97006/g.230795  ORF Transcript_97006/g.230795 Transcript_97006/m.230795 type:complete len:260 (-) Transcript_97006:491-1270(-)